MPTNNLSQLTQLIIVVCGVAFWTFVVLVLGDYGEHVPVWVATIRSLVE